MVIDLANQSKPISDTPPKSTEQVQCEADGGKWDSSTSTCIMPEPEPVTEKPTPEPTPQAKLTKPEVIRDQDTGEITGVTLPSGKTFFGSKEDIDTIVGQRVKATQLPVGAAETGTAQAQLEIEQAQEELQTTGAPVRRELDPTLERGESIPVVGPLFVKIKKLLDVQPNSLLDRFTGIEKGEEFFELRPEELTTITLSQIEKNEIERGLTDSEKFGSFIEALGLGGVSNFAAEKPSENVQTILRELKTQKTRATNAEIKVKDGTWRQAYGEEVINEIEGNIQRMESRMKLLIQDSPELKFNSDGVNFIETKILEARERLFTAKINMLSGAAKDPSEIDLLISLQESIQGEDFEIK